MTNSQTSSLRIAIVAKYSPLEHGGIETHIRELVDALESCNTAADVTCYCYGRDDSTTRLNSRAILVLRRVSCRVFSAPVSLGLLRELRSSINSFDVVHLHLPSPWTVLIAWLYCRVPIVVTVHGMASRNWFFRHMDAWFSRFSLAKASQIVVSVKQNVQAYGIADYAAKIRVVPYGIADPQGTLTRGAAGASTPDSPYFLFVGRLVHYKGLDYLVEAMRMVPCGLVVVGEGPMLPRLRSLVEAWDLSGRVQLVGPLSRTAVKHYLERCTGYVQPSSAIGESFAISVIEAMAFSKPVVVTRLGTGLESLVHRGANGLSVPARDPVALAAALNKLLEDDDLRRQLGRRGREIYLQRYTSEPMANALLNIYANAANRT